MALQFNRIVTFSEVKLEATDWVSHPDGKRDCPCCTFYTALNETSSITITRSDGKVLDFDPPRGYQVLICENVIEFHSDLGQPSDADFK